MKKKRRTRKEQKEKNDGDGGMHAPRDNHTTVFLCKTCFSLTTIGLLDLSEKRGRGVVVEIITSTSTGDRGQRAENEGQTTGDKDREQRAWGKGEEKRRKGVLDST